MRLLHLAARRAIGQSRRTAAIAALELLADVHGAAGTPFAATTRQRARRLASGAEAWAYWADIGSTIEGGARPED